MSASYRDCSRIVVRLQQALSRLERDARLLDVPPLAGREWYELLARKLLPQLRDDAFLVVAVVGGTNIGKSVVFNHIAGAKASATSPLASGTKHPVCLAPAGFDERHDLADIFQGFRIEEWTRSESALEEHAEHRLFWQTNPALPENLLVLDTPDIDSDTPVNWERADHIRRAADVLIAVLTQQKYNDAAVKRFFRQAAEEDKAVVVLFNQCELPDDEEYWPLWLATFCGETGIDPELIYIAPSDRKAAEANELPFYERRMPGHGERPVSAGRCVPEHSRPPSPVESLSETRVESGALHEPDAPGGLRPPLAGDEPRDLAEDLSRLHFADIKLRTLRGSLRYLLDAESGVPEYLREVDESSGRFRRALELLADDRLARVDRWPPIPSSVLVQSIRHWWQERRTGFSATIHGTYNALGRGLAWPFRAISRQFREEQRPPMDLYREREWSAILETVEKAYDHLTHMSEYKNEVLARRLKQVLGGRSRVELLERLKAAHAEVDLERELDRLVAVEMDAFQRDSPKFYTFLKRLDQAAAVARPATSVVLFIVGFGPAGNAAAHLVTDSAIQTAVHVVGDVTGGTVAAAVGDTAISGTASSGMGYIEAKFRRIQETYTARRVEWLLRMLDEHLWGTLLEDLRAGATLSDGEANRQVEELLAELAGRIAAPAAVGG
ncbi:MAG: GTPase [Planctomycetaceae bacterium]